MQGTGHDFLAGAGFAEDQHVGGGRRQGADLLAQALHGRALTEQTALQLLAVGQGQAQAAVVHHQATQIQCATHTVEQFFAGEGLFQKIVGAGAHGLHSQRHIAVAGDQQDRQLRVLGLNLLEQLQAVEAAAIDGSTLILLAADGGEEIAGRLAHRTGGVPLGVCTSTFAHDADGLAANRVAYGGKIAAEVVASTGPWFACVRASSSAPRPEGGGGDATIEVVSLPRSDLVAASLATTSEPALGDAADIGNSALIVAGGRGVGEAGFEAIRTLADKLGAAWAGSLPTVDAGWVPVSRQVGQSGRHVEPEVYLAIGISGTLQHFAGVGERARIIAINKDAEADIFKFADLGIVALWEDVVPNLIRLAGSESRTDS